MSYSPLSQLACLTCPHQPTHCSHVKCFETMEITEEMPMEVQDLAKVGLNKPNVSKSGKSSFLKPKSWKSIPVNVPQAHQEIFRSGHKLESDNIPLLPEGVCHQCHRSSQSVHTTDTDQDGSAVPIILPTYVILSKG